MSAYAIRPHTARSPRWLGDSRQYQREALSAYAAARDQCLLPWSWVSTTCDLDQCLDPRCMTVWSPTFIDYPAGVCTYCGVPAGSKDHLIPRPYSGDTQRRLVAVVPACADCNSRINDTWAVSVAERRAIAQQSIGRKYRKLLSEPPWTKAQMAELGNTLRQHIIKGNHEREWVKARLEWPLDPNYDLRAFQRSGIEDPAGLGLI